MKVQIGSPVEGDDFFGREKALEYAWSLIKDGNNVILPSPRRVGKTSFALKILEYARAEGWETIDISLEKHTESGFVEVLAKEFIRTSKLQTLKDSGKKLLEFISDLNLSADAGGVKLGFKWQQNQENIYEQLEALMDHDKPTLIFLDEVTVLLTKMLKEDNGLESVTSFLHWMRGTRITKNSKIKWIYCSSVGIENFTHTHNLSETMNDIPDFELKSFSKEVSVQMLDRLAESYSLPLNQSIKEAVVDKLGYCLPFFLQLMFDKIRYLNAVEDKELEPNIVDEAFSLLIEQDHFNTWIERIEKQYAELGVYAFGLLKQVCQVKEGISRESLYNFLISKITDPDRADSVLSKLIYMLKNDGYLIFEQELYLFRSGLLREFWLNRFVK